MGTYIVQSNQMAYKPADKLDDGQAFHTIHRYGEELELDDEHPHTERLVKGGVVISKKAHEQRQEANANVSELDSNVGYDQTANDSKTAEATKSSSNGGSSNGGSSKG